MNPMQSRFRWYRAKVIEGAYWWVMRKVYGSRIDGMEFVDLRVGSESGGVRITLAAALGMLAESGSAFEDLVRKELRFVAVLPDSYERVAPWLRSYSSPFRAFEASNVQYLATRLVWGAAYCRAYRTARPHPTSLPEAEARTQAAAAQLAFVARLPNAEAWTSYLRDQEHRAGPARRPPGS